MSGRVAIFDAVSGKSLQELRAPVPSPASVLSWCPLFPLPTSLPLPAMALPRAAADGDAANTGAKSGESAAGEDATLPTYDEDESLAAEDLAYAMAHALDDAHDDRRGRRRWLRQRRTDQREQRRRRRTADDDDKR